MERIKVFLSDPQVLFREGIHFTLSGDEDFEVTGETTSNAEALHSIEENPPHVAILNMKNGKVTGPEITQQIRRNLPSVAVILTMDEPSEEMMFQAAKSGAGACIDKNIDPDELINIIHEVAAGGRPINESLITAQLAPRILGEFESLSALSEHLNKLLAHLSPKEAQLLKSISEGQTAEQISTQTGLAETAVKQQASLIVNKLVANEQAQAVIEAAHRSMPFTMGEGARGPAQSNNNYITKEEFNEFKDSLTERLKGFIGELA